MHISLL